MSEAFHEAFYEAFHELALEVLPETNTFSLHTATVVKNTENNWMIRTKTTKLKIGTEANEKTKENVNENRKRNANNGCASKMRTTAEWVLNLKRTTLNSPELTNQDRHVIIVKESTTARRAKITGRR